MIPFELRFIRRWLKLIGITIEPVRCRRCKKPLKSKWAKDGIGPVCRKLEAEINVMEEKINETHV